MKQLSLKSYLKIIEETEFGVAVGKEFEERRYKQKSTVR